MLIVVPASKASVNVEPAGTENPLTLTVVQATAAAMSASDEIVPAHARAATEKRTITRALVGISVTRRRNSDFGANESFYRGGGDEAAAAPQNSGKVWPFCHRSSASLMLVLSGPPIAAARHAEKYHTTRLYPSLGDVVRAQPRASKDDLLNS
jgi:hypothetical protein